MKRKNPISPLMNALDYQACWGFYLCAKWLRTPSKFKWIKFETIPDEADTNEFYLDDIIQYDKSDFYYLYQIKHKQNPSTDLYTWKDLLETQKNIKKSLIKKWFDSYFKSDLRNRIKLSMFITNGSAEAEILKCLKNNKIIIGKVKKYLPKVYSKIKEQLEDKSEIDEFFNNFRFLFKQPGLDKLENKTRDILLQDLKATDSGVNSLSLRIHKECRRSTTRTLTIEQIRKWCEWDNPAPLNEEFEIPRDFVFFNDIKHQKILNNLKNPNGGIVVIFGKPGTGKSTYLSKLHGILGKNQIITIRHHYQVSQKETNPVERLNSNRVIEAIKAQIKQFPDELKTLAYKNSKSVSIREYLHEIAQSLSKKGKTFVFIIDGLDHVLRYADESELKDFLNEVIFPQPGLWIVCGTQVSAKQYLPQIVFDKCPEKKWTEIKGIVKEGVYRIINQNIIELNLPAHKDQREAIYEKIYKLTEGNPLHLRYTLSQLKHKLNDKPLTKYELNDLLPYGGDIAKYYSAMWNKISLPGKTIAILIATAGFPLDKKQILEVLGLFKTDPSKITDGFDSIFHLLKKDKNNLLIYHNSYERFICSQKEFNEQKKIIRGHLKNWLEKSNYEELKWSELRKLYYDLGDPKQILEIDKNWLIKAISFPRNTKQIIKQLALGAKAAFEEGLFGKTFELSNLKTCYQNSLEFAEEASEKIWEQSFIGRSPDVSRFNLNEYSTRKLSIISELAEKQGNSRVILNTINVLRDRHDKQKYSKKGDIGSHIPEISACLTKIIPFDRQHDLNNIHKYIKQFENSGWASDLFEIYVGSLLSTKQFSKIYELLNLDLTNEEKQVVLDKCAEYDLELKGNQFLETSDKENHSQLSTFSLLYLIMQSQEIRHVPALPKYENFPTFVKEYETGKRKENAKNFSDNFYLGLIYTLLDREKEIKIWIDNAEDRWALNIMAKIFEASILTAKKIKENNPIDYKEVFKEISPVKKLNFTEDRNLYELQFSLQASLSSILKTIHILKLVKGQVNEISKSDLHEIIYSKFYDCSKLLEFLLGLKTPCLSEEAYKSLITDEKSKWKTLITNFSDRAEHYADLTELSSIHQDDDNRREFLKLAANNLIGYRYHKDIYLDGVLKSIQICHQAGSKKTNDWIGRIAPIVENITEYTDGDETRHFPRELARVLISVDPKILYKYYYQKAQDEELFLSQDIFKYVLRSLRFNKEIDTALAITALDEDSLGELKTLSQTEKKAAGALKIIEDYFGNIEYQKEDNNSSESTSEKGMKDYSLVMPRELEKYLDSIKTRWDQREFLILWIKYWLDKENADKKEIYQILVTIIEQDGLHNTAGEILDLLYPLAYEFDNDKAFDFLCLAQANDNGWDLYWTHTERAEKRWDFIKKHYSDRYMEFFEKSIFHSGKRYGRGSSYFVPIPRGIEFLKLFNNLGPIEEITEASVKFAESLMADLELPVSLWITSDRDIDLIDILFQRLLWPSPLVREKAATGLARMLLSSQDKEQIFGRLLNWIENQKLESVVAIGLLPLIKAIEEEHNIIKCIDLQKVINALPLTSIVIEKLVEELVCLLEPHIKLTPARRSISKVPADYEPCEFFKKYIKSFLASTYFIWANEISKRTGRQFLKQWAYTSSEILKECEVKEEVGDTMYFLGGLHAPAPSLPGMSTMLSEVYRSAFLRVLQYFNNQDLIDKDLYHEYVYATLPIELSFWKVKPSRAPKWWPMLEHSSSKKNEENGNIEKIAYMESIEQIVDRNNKNNQPIILGIEGAIKPAEGWINSVFDTSITLIGFGYQVINANIPRAEEVGKKLLNSPSIFVIPSQAFLPFNFLESYAEHYSTEDGPIRIDGLLIYPLIARIRALTINLWQWFRAFHVPFSLSKELDHNLEIRLGKHKWSYYKEKFMVAESGDWLEGLKERHDKNSGISHGIYIETDPGFLNSYLKGNKLRLGYMMKTKYRYRKHDYEEAKVFEEYQLLNVSRVII